MMLAAWLALAAVLLHALSIIAHVGGARPWLVVLLAPAMLCTPLLLPEDARFTRFAWGCASLMHVFKAVDLALAPAAAPTLRAWLVHLVNPFSLVLRRLEREPLPARAACLRAAGRCLALALAGAGPAAWAFTTDALSSSFALEHVARITLGYIVVVGLLNGAAWLVRAAGGRARLPFDDPFAAVTPADFWRRYNRIVGQALHENVWAPAGGRRDPVRGTLIAFVVSALMHEYVFGVALGVQGYQTAFFLVQGVAVAATLRARPRGAAAVAGAALTYAFNMATGVLFMASAQQVLPIIYTRPPLP